MEYVLIIKIILFDDINVFPINTFIIFGKKALRHAPASSSEMDASLVATLYVNRASAMHVSSFFSPSF